MKPESLEYGVICGDCRDLAVVKRLLGGRKVNLVFTSPPYADRRKYDESSKFQPIPPERYVDWYKDVAAVIAEILAPDGSYLLNIHPHAEGGERSLYVMDLVIAHQRQWGWRFVDQLCWRKTDDGVPGGWPNRFKNAWEGVFHFCRQPEIKFRPEAAGHWSDDCFDYSPNNSKSKSGSGLLGSGPRGAAADKGKLLGGCQTTNRNKNVAKEGCHGGITRPSNVVECKTETAQGSHAAPFPRALANFFIRSFSDAGDVCFDPFMGSGTVLVESMALGRSCYGCEISPAYTDVIVRRAQDFSKQPFYLDGCGQTFDQVQLERGI